MDKRIFIHDVVARDGLQIEPQWVPTEHKIELIDRLSATGVAKIEATSFVSPKAMPNLRDAEAVMAGIRAQSRGDATSRWCRTRAAPSARSAPTSTRSCWSSRCRRRTIAPTCGAASRESFAGFAEVFDVVARQRQERSPARWRPRSAVRSKASIPEQQVLDGVARYVDLGVAGVTLADTTGMANPRQVEALVRRVRERWPDARAHAALSQHARHGTRQRARRPRRRRRRATKAASAASAAVRSRRARPATSAPKIWCTCCRAWATTPASISTCCSRHRGAWARSSAHDLPGQVVKAGKVDRPASAAARAGR